MPEPYSDWFDQAEKSSHMCVRHTLVNVMQKEQNVLGALALVLNDGIRSATNASMGMSGETAAAVMLIVPIRTLR